MPVPPPHPGQPSAEYRNPGYGYSPPLPYPPPPSARTGRTGWILGGVAALAFVLAIGLTVGLLAGRSSGKTAEPAAGPAYSMSAISNACDLVDPIPLTKWSSTPAGPPRHKETRPSTYGAGSLSCEIDYSSGGNPLDQAGIIVDVEFTNGTAPPAYDGWKRYYAAKTGPGMSFGAVAGIGTLGFWHSEVFGDLGTDTMYVVCVQDGNVSVSVRLDFSREKGVSAVGRDDLEPIAESQARKTLNGLKNH